jgi:serine protease
MGKCGGFDSDIIAGMRWAAGLNVPGVPPNPNPARILNLSMGASSDCSQAYFDTVTELTARGIVIVASAGNDSGPVESPANCPGVIAVGGVRHIGTKVGYSSMGPEVAISAPAGNCVNTGGPCLYSIVTTTNLGQMTPGANGYTDETNYNVGTSFSAPQVAGVAALMLSLNPALTPADVTARIKRAARPFPRDETLLTCPETSPTGEAKEQCNCTTTTCGAGLLDAAAAALMAIPPTASIQTLDPLVAGTTIRLDSSGSAATKGLVIAAWHWTLVSSPAGSGSALTSANAATTSLQATASGSYTVSLQITDSLGATSTNQINLSVINPTPVVTVTPTPVNSGGGGAVSSIELLFLLVLFCATYFGQRSSAQKEPPAKP